jgi:hypothetical protein
VAAHVEAGRRDDRHSARLHQPPQHRAVAPAAARLAVDQHVAARRAQVAELSQR